MLRIYWLIPRWRLNSRKSKTVIQQLDFFIIFALSIIFEKWSANKSLDPRTCQPRTGKKVCKQKNHLFDTMSCVSSPNNFSFLGVFLKCLNESRSWPTFGTDWSWVWPKILLCHFDGREILITHCMFGFASPCSDTPGYHIDLNLQNPKYFWDLSAVPSQNWSLWAFYQKTSNPFWDSHSPPPHPNQPPMLDGWRVQFVVAAARITQIELENQWQTSNPKQTLFGICVRLMVFVAVLIVFRLFCGNLCVSTKRSYVTQECGFTLNTRHEICSNCPNKWFWATFKLPMDAGWCCHPPLPIIKRQK